MAISPAGASARAYPLPGALPYRSVGRDRAGGMDTSDSAQAQPPDARAAAPVVAGSGDLSEGELRELQQLQQRDREVRAHEMAHVAAGAGLVTRGASYSYQTGPDGQRYAIGGEVGIDTSPGRTPEETLVKAEQVRAAALAPADPSPQDRQVASQATRMAMDARMEIARAAYERGNGGSSRPDAEVEGRASAYLVRQVRSAYEAGAASASAPRPPGLDLTARA